VLVEQTTSAATYRLYALPGMTGPPIVSMDGGATLAPPPPHERRRATRPRRRG